MSDSLTFDESVIGVWTEPIAFYAARDGIAAYSAATNDPIPAHRDGSVANPVYAIVPVFGSLMKPALQAIPAQLHNQVVHLSQDFEFNRPIFAGDQLVASGKLLGWEGGSKGTRGSVYLETRTVGDRLVNVQRLAFFVRGHDAGPLAGEVLPGHTVDESVRRLAPVATVTQHVDDDQTFRYSPAAGDPMPIHLDDAVAKAAGLPGIIVHGLCTQAFTAWGLLTEVGGADVTRLKRLSVRFAAPVLPGQDLTTDIRKAGSINGTTAFAFETTVGDTTVIKDGYAEFAN